MPDKGADRIWAYELDADHGTLQPAGAPFVEIQAGAGPRHLVFHPKGHFAYLINELDASINAFSYDYLEGSMKEIQEVSTLPMGYQGFNACADIHITPDGKYLYGSNRGHDSIVAFSINENTGELTFIEHEPVQGVFPRNFMIDRSGTFLYVANQNTDDIVAFRINQETGELDPTGFRISCPTPVCLVEM